MPTSRTLLIANNFPPMLGGSASVYANLAACRPDRIMVLAPSHNYLADAEFEHWREHDAAVPYRIVRLPLLRTLMDQHQAGIFGRLRFLLSDLLIRLRVVASVLRSVLFENVRSICIGELLASAWMLRVFGLLPGVTTSVYIHGEEITTKDAYDPGHERARRALHAADEIIVVSRFTREAVAELIGEVNRTKITLIENGVNRAFFTVGAKSPELLQAYGLEGKFVFVSVCRLLEKKGIDNAIRAFASVVKRHPNSRYLIVGDGDFAPRLRALAKELDLDSKVIFTGRVSDEQLASHYRLGDVFIMPNRRMPDGDTEGFGLVFLEANSCGIPVIAGSDGGSTDAVAHEVNGLLVDGSSVEQIEAAMLRLREDPQLRADLTARGLERAERAGWEDKAGALLALGDRIRPKQPPDPEIGSWPQILGVGLFGATLILVSLPYLLLLRFLAKRKAAT